MVLPFNNAKAIQEGSMKVDMPLKPEKKLSYYVSHEAINKIKNKISFTNNIID